MLPDDRFCPFIIDESFPTTVLVLSSMRKASYFAKIKLISPTLQSLVYHRPDLLSRVLLRWYRHLLKLRPGVCAQQLPVYRKYATEHLLPTILLPDYQTPLYRCRLP